MAYNKIQTFEIIRIEINLYTQTRISIINKCNKIGDILTPFVLSNKIAKRMYQQYPINIKEYNCMMAIYGNGLNRFRLNDLSYCTISPLHFVHTLPGLITKGYLVKAGYYYSTTPKYDDYIDSFKLEYRKLLNKFGSIERISNKRRFNRLD